MAQRLVRTLCRHCKQPVAVDGAAWRELVQPWSVEEPARIMAAQGCIECRETGYMGRQGIYEVLLMSESVRQHIGDGHGGSLGNSDGAIDALRANAMKEGMRTLRLSGAQKVARGETTIEEVMRVAPAPGNQ